MSQVCARCEIDEHSRCMARDSNGYCCCHSKYRNNALDESLMNEGLRLIGWRNVRDPAGEYKWLSPEMVFRNPTIWEKDDAIQLAMEM